MSDAPAIDSVAPAASGREVGWAARVGLAARATVYLLLGWLTILVAAGDQRHVDQKSVLAALANPLGGILLLIVTLGLACYALWRLSEVLVGVTGEPDGFRPRVVSLLRFFAYAALTFMAISVYVGSRQPQSGQQEQLAQGLMASDVGRSVVAVAGLALVGTGAYMAYQGVTTAFVRYFHHLPAKRAVWIVWMGRIGSTGRGIVFAITGILVVIAAWQTDPGKAGGIDYAIHAVLRAPGGQVFVLGLGAGLVIFGLYGFAEAAWRAVPDGD